MSKLAHQRAYEQYPQGNDGSSARIGYTLAYDQAMQDIKEFIYDKFNIHQHDNHVIQYDSDTPLESMDDFIKQIENYIENESEN